VEKRKKLEKKKIFKHRHNLSGSVRKYVLNVIKRNSKIMTLVFYIKLMSAKRTMHLVYNLRASCVPSSNCAIRP
jgi:ribosomal protein L18